MFRRKKKDEADLEDRADEGVEAQADGGEDVPAEPARPQGPWDVDDAPEDEVNRIDLGGMLVPIPAGTEVRVDVGPDGEVVAATLVQGQSSMQVNVFAAPRRTGIWDEVRAEIAETLAGGGGQAAEVEGPYGIELHAGVPVESGGLAPARFVGVDGPRWFVRALLTGPAAQDREVAAPLEAALRDVVVVRGTEAMAVRDPLPLRLPKEVTASSAAAQEAEEASLDMPERGPEITETR